MRGPRDRSALGPANDKSSTVLVCTRALFGKHPTCNDEPRKDKGSLFLLGSLLQKLRSMNNEHQSLFFVGLHDGLLLVTSLSVKMYLCDCY